MEKRAIFKGAQLNLKTGETVGLFGRNGSEKSTLVKILFGTMPTNARSVYLDAVPFDPDTTIAKKLIAIVY